jgi:hypothetical protein
MVTLLGGLVGGLVATIVMTVFMRELGDGSPPPTAHFWSKYVGSESPEDALPQGMVLHLGYGIVAGAVFVLLAPQLGISLDQLDAALLWGLVWGVILFVAGAVFWLILVLDESPGKEQVGLFLLVHLIYGATLGAWIGLGIVG